MCDISSENYGNYDKHLHNESAKSICSAFPLTSTHFTKDRGSPSILSNESLFSSQKSDADDENFQEKKNKFLRKKPSYYNNKKKKNLKNSENNKNDDDNYIDNSDNHEMDDRNERNDRNDRNERNERRTSIVSKEEEEVKI